MKKLIMALMIGLAGIALADGLVTLIDGDKVSNPVIIGVPSNAKLSSMISQTLSTNTATVPSSALLNNIVTSGIAVVTNPVVQTVAEGSAPNVVSGAGVKTSFNSMYVSSGKKVGINIGGKMDSSGLFAVAAKGYTNVVMVSFVFDDATTNDLTRMYPMFVGYNVKANIAIPAVNLGSAGSWPLSTLTNVQNSLGWEVLSHSYGHTDLTALTEAQLIADFEAAKSRFSTNGINVKHLVYPFGLRNNMVRRIARDYYASAIRVATASNTNYIPIIPPLEQYDILRAIGDQQTTNQLWDALNKAVTNGNGWVVYMMHTATWNDTDTAAVSNFIGQVIAANIPIVTVSEALGRIGNVVDVGNRTTDDLNGQQYFVVSADGKIHNNQFNTATQNIATLSAQVLNPPQIVRDSANATGKYQTVVFSSGFVSNAWSTNYTSYIHPDRQDISKSLISFNSSLPSPLWNNCVLSYGYGLPVFNSGTTEAVWASWGAVNVSGIQTNLSAHPLRGVVSGSESDTFNGSNFVEFADFAQCVNPKWFSFRVYLSANATVGTPIASKYRSSDNQREWALTWIAGNNINLFVSSNGVAGSGSQMTAEVSTGVWNSVCIAYSNGLTTLYKNGVKYGGVITNTATAMFDGTAPVYIGRYLAEYSTNLSIRGFQIGTNYITDSDAALMSR